MAVVDMFVTSNGEIFRDAFEGISWLLSSNTFGTAFKISVVFSIISAMVSFIMKKDFLIMMKYLTQYFIASVLLLSPKVDVNFVDSSHALSANYVEDVPIGLALPASLVTSIGHALTESFEMVFSMPDDQAYTKTGMLFGSKLFRLATTQKIEDPEVQSAFSEYFRNCVIGDIRINHKYSITDLANTRDIWALISEKPSVTRGLYIADTRGAIKTFHTCLTATPLIKNMLGGESENALKRLGQETSFNLQVKEMLTSSYEYYVGLSEEANKIMAQNLAINAIRDGVNDYASFSGSTAAMLNLSYTKSMQSQRLNWATLGKIAADTLPTMQVVLLLLMLCMFPIIVLLSINMQFGTTILKNYVISLIWLESWPLLFAIFNFAMTYYIHMRTGFGVESGVTLLSQNRLLQQHSDFAGMAGYLCSSIPFISVYLVKSMATAFSNAAQAIGGAGHMAASQSASEITSGNLSMGNVSYGNASAYNNNSFKHDSNLSMMRGMSTFQEKNGMTVSHTEDGSSVYNAEHATSHLPFRVEQSSAYATALREQASNAKELSMEDATQYSSSLSLAKNDLVRMLDSSSQSMKVGESFTHGQDARVDQAVSALQSSIKTYADKYHVSEQTAYENVLSVYANGEISGKYGPFSGKAGISDTGSRSDKWGEGHDNEQLLSSNEINDIKRNLDIVASWGKSQSADQMRSSEHGIAQEFSQHLSQAESAATHFGVHQRESEQYSKAADFVKSHQESVTNNLTQDFVDWYLKRDPRADGNLRSYSSRPQSQEDVAKAMDLFGQERIAALAANPSSFLSKSGFGERFERKMVEHEQSFTHHLDQASMVSSSVMNEKAEFDQSVTQQYEQRAEAHVDEHNKIKAEQMERNTYVQTQNDFPKYETDQKTKASRSQAVREVEVLD
jgi:conjugal transfer mating pair stabilization protein TraG